ncbi:MAG: GGDEF domain-containing protein [Pseudomonadota bacterium]
MRHGFRYKLLALALLPILAGLFGVVLFVMQVVEQEVRKNAHADLRIGAKVVDQYLASRNQDLSAKVDVLAADYAIKEVLAFGEASSLRSALINHGNRVEASFAAFVWADGSKPVFSHIEHEAPFEETLMDLIDENEDAPQISALLVDHGVHQIIAAPVRAPTVIGFLVLGFEVGDSTLARIESLTALETALIRINNTNSSIIAPTPAHSAADAWLGEISEQNTTFTAHTSAGEFISLNTTFLPGDIRVLIGLRRSVDEAMQPYRDARDAIGLLALAILLVVAGLALWVAAGMARPLRRLTEVAEEMSDGNYRVAVSVRSKDEVGTLANAFRSMQGGIAEREAKISHQAYHDSLTGLPNREQLVRRINDHIFQQAPLLHLACIRLTNVQTLMSSIGQKAGDELIIEAGRQIQKILPAVASLHHTGTDEFFIFFASGSLEKVHTVLNEISHSLFGGVATSHHNVIVQAHCGSSVFPDHGKEPADVVRAARIAASDAEQRRVPHATYEPAREEQFDRQIRIINDLPRAIAGAEIQLVYQPKITIETGAIYGAEVLVRWEHEELGFLPPDEFIPAAEQAGTITALTRYVIQRALVALKTWREEHPALTLGVNLSTRDLLDRGLPKFVQIQLDNSGLPADALTLEITETSIMENTDRALEVLHLLRDTGVRISIDDFGTGQSSLSQLHMLPVDELKIDKGFVMHLESDPASEILVDSTITLAHRFGLSVVAEGVEDEYSLRRLAELNCEVAQGYFFSKPVSQSTFTMWARDHVPKAYPERRDAGQRPFNHERGGNIARLNEARVSQDSGQSGHQ